MDTHTSPGLVTGPRKAPEMSTINIDEIRRLAVAAIDSDLAHHSGDVIISADTFYRPVLGLLTEFERLRNAALDAVSDLAAEHHPTWASDDAKANGKDPVGCVICWPKDGGWPCASAMVNDDLRTALSGGFDGENTRA